MPDEEGARHLLVLQHTNSYRDRCMRRCVWAINVCTSERLLSLETEAHVGRGASGSGHKRGIFGESLGQVQPMSKTVRNMTRGLNSFIPNTLAFACPSLPGPSATVRPSKRSYDDWLDSHGKLKLRMGPRCICTIKTTNHCGRVVAGVWREIRAEAMLHPPASWLPF